MDLSETLKLAGSAPLGAFAGASARERRECVTAWLSGVEYGFDSASVEQIRPFTSAKRGDAAVGHVIGELRCGGCMVPVIDLRLSLRMPVAEYRPSMLVLVLASAYGRIGIIVDSMSDFIDVEFAPGDIVRRVAGITDLGSLAPAAGGVKRQLCRLKLVDVDQLLEAVQA